MTNLEDRLKLEAQIQAQEARSQRATVREIYQAVTGRTGEPGDWHGSQPVLALIEERDALRRMSSEFGAALITARARVAELGSRLSSLDCRYTGAGIGEVSGSHCPADNPCDRCVAERRIARLEALADACAGLIGNYGAGREQGISEIPSEVLGSILGAMIHISPGDKP